MVLGQGANHGRRGVRASRRDTPRRAATGEREGSQEACQTQLLRGRGRGNPQEAPGHVFSPGQRHFPVSTALVYFDKAVSTPHGRTPLQTQRSPVHPGDRCSQWKTRSITPPHPPAQRAVETGCRRAPRGCPWSWVVAGGGEDSQQCQQQAFRAWRVQVGGGAAHSGPRSHKFGNLLRAQLSKGDRSGKYKNTHCALIRVQPGRGSVSVVSIGRISD